MLRSRCIFLRDASSFDDLSSDSAEVSWRHPIPVNHVFNIILVRPGSRTPVHPHAGRDRKSTRLNSSHTVISYAVFCLKKKKDSIDDHVAVAGNLSNWCY